MPILKYNCTHCGKEFAKIFLNPEDAPRKCPVCGTEHLVELGDAFSYDEKSLNRYACVSCETCGGDDPCLPPASS